jgi:hypothetical protein
VTDDTGDVYLFRGVFRYYRSKPRQVRASVHLEREQYRLDHPADPAITPVTQLEGERVAFTLSLYTLEPQIIVTVDWSPARQAGRVVDSGLDPDQPVRQNACGYVNGWFYEADKLVMLWDCLLHDQFRDNPLATDINLYQLWRSVERWAVQQFPDVRQLATPFRDTKYPDAEYRDFLYRLGYAPLQKAHAAFGKRPDVSQPAEDVPS